MHASEPLELQAGQLILSGCDVSQLLAARASEEPWVRKVTSVRFVAIVIAQMRQLMNETADKNSHV